MQIRSNYYNIVFSFLAGLLLVGWCTPADASATDGVQFELIVRQKPVGEDNYYEIRRDTMEVQSGKLKNTFLVNFSLDLQVNKIDSMAVEFDAFINTVGLPAYNDAKKFRVEYNLPSRIENIPGKNESLLQLLISPRKKVEINNDFCPFAIGEGKDFVLSPSANFDFYFIRGSLADYNWNMTKGYLEADFMQFRNVFNFQLTTKISYYLSPCELDAVDWDSRFGYAIDPGRTRIFSLYSHDYISSEAILTNMLVLLRQWGYAPPFIVEGLAGYFEFNNYEVKKLKKTKGIPKLDSLLVPEAYYRADPVTADAVSGSFIKYLADNFGIGKVKEWYNNSDDLNMARNLSEIYGQPIDSLEAGWYNYIDTMTITRKIFDYYAGRAAALMNRDKQIEYYEDMLGLDKTKRDSIDTRQKLNMVLYQIGRYYDAEKGYRELIAIDTPQAVYWQIVGNLDMINDNLQAAWDDFDSAYAIDTTYVSAKLLQAEIYYDKNEIDPAIALVEKYYPFEKSTIAKIEFLLLMGKLYEARGQEGDSVKAHNSYSDAAAWCKEMIGKAPTDPSFKYRLGLAEMGLGQYKEAAQLLEIAGFSESRAYFLGDIWLELGKVNDLMGNRQAAIRYYQECLNSRSSARQHELSRKYIDEPYTR